jgi:hypothetical protein
VNGTEVPGINGITSLTGLTGLRGRMPDRARA